MAVIQWAYLAAPTVPLMVDWLTASSDTTITQDRGLSTARSKSVKFAMSWDSEFRVHQLEYGDPDSDYIRFEFAEFERVIAELPELPRSRTHTSRSISNRKSPTLRSYTGSIKTSIPKDPEYVLGFDAAADKLMKYDAESGDVTFPDGRILYNRNRLEAMMDEGSWSKTLRPWAMSVLGVGVFVGGVVTIRRMRRA